MSARPTQHPAANSESRKRQAAAIFAPVHVRQAEVEGLLREARAEAWDEGNAVGFHNASAITTGIDEPVDDANPYRADQIAGGDS